MENFYKVRAFLITVAMLWFTTMNLSSLNAQHQPFGEEGAVWYLSHKFFPFAGSINQSYFIIPFRIVNIGDTLMQEKLCQMLHFESIGYTIPGFGLFGYAKQDTIFIHNDSGKIFYFDPFVDKFKLAFDFNAEVGDSWVTEFPCEDSTLIWWNPELFQDTFEFVVNNVSYLETEGPSLKQLHVNRNSPFIERIGSPGFIMPYYEDLCSHLGHNDPVFLCSYYDPEVGLIEFQDYPCDTKLFVNLMFTNDLHEIPFVILPNPAFDQIFIQFPENLNGQHAVQVNLYNQLGQQVLSDILPSSGQLNIQHLPPGLYFVHLQHEELLFKPQKLVLH